MRRLHDADSAFVKGLGRDSKGKLSLLLYIIGILLTPISQWLGLTIYVMVATMWFIPDRRFERQLR
ncbi:hypothetical protein [Mesorhizobium sp. A623]